MAGVDRATALFSYDESSRAIVLAAKNHGRRDLLTDFGRQIAAVVAADPVAGAIDVVTWMPPSAHQRRRRGYDQGRVLARSVGRSLGLRHRSLLARSVADAQFGKGRVERRVGPVLRLRRSPPRRVLLVDDVITTGASMEAAARCLRSGGVEFVVVAAISLSRHTAFRPPTSYCGRTNTSRGNPGEQREVPRWR